MTDRELIVYLAGFFDGEGTICISHRNNRASYELRICVGQKELDPLPMYVKVFGGNIYKQKRYGIHCLNQWNLTPKSSIKNFLDIVYPYLITKKQEADVAYKFISATENCDNGGWWQNLTEDKKRIRQQCFEECRQIKIDKYAYQNIKESYGHII
jgi:hypothetical protein